MSGSQQRRGGARSRRRTLALAVLVVLADQLSKAWAWRHLPAGEAVALLPGLLRLRQVINTGAAFSLFTGASTALALVSALVSAAVLVWILRAPPAGPWRSGAFGLLLGGALGNGLDRWRLGWVLDFLEFVPIRFPVFNVADVAINAAVVCFVVDLLRGSRTGDG